MEKGVHEQGAKENICTYQRENVTGGCKKKYYNKEFHDLGPSPSIIMMMGWVEPTALTVLMRNA